MQRDKNIETLRSNEFDVLVIGAGVHGACVARDAALRGLKVALIDKVDLNGCTSHNSLKTIHGGIRYLQHLNLKRTIESIREQAIWLKTAPHLVRPLPFLMPTYGWGMRGPLVMYLGIRLFELIGLGRNRKLRAENRIPFGRVISANSCLSKAPGIKKENLTGGAIWYDAQVAYADKAVFQICQQASDKGAAIANYLEAQEFIFESNQVAGVKVRDLVDSSCFEIKAKQVVNAAGPWVKELLSDANIENDQSDTLPLTKSMNLVTTRAAPNYAVSIQSKFKSDSKVDSANRLYFVVPWDGQAMLGTTHFSYTSNVNGLTYEQDEIEDFVEQINTAYPDYCLSIDEVSYCYQGLTPAEENESGQSSRSHHSRVIDYSDMGISNLISLVSVKWTTARLVAERATDLLVRKLKLDRPCLTRYTEIPDAKVTSDTFLLLEETELRIEIKKHIEHSMLISLVDLITRRTDEFVRGTVDGRRIKLAARILAEELEWDEARKKVELDRVLNLWLPEKIRHEMQKPSFWV